MKLWWSKNWDKVISVLVSTVIAGIVGFFLAVRATDSKIADLDTKISNVNARITSLQTLHTTQHTDVVAPTKAQAERNDKQIVRLVADFDHVKKMNEQAASHNRVLDRLLELDRSNTVRAMHDIFEKWSTTFKPERHNSPP